PRMCSWLSTCPWRSDAWERKLSKADEMYEEFIIRYQDTNVEQRERLSGIKRSYQLMGGAFHAGEEARSRQGALTARRGGREAHRDQNA
ncbi:MAG: hypothetical protein ACKPKO_33315, partial [Candidatus Fonsibacter sp.]